jgi:predicted ester cyclase
MPTMQPRGKTTDEAREKNKAVVRQVLEAFNSGETAVIDKVAHAELKDHTPVARTRPGREGMKQQIATIHEAFPDARFEEETMISEGDMVFLRWRMTGTHKGRMFRGAEPTGREVTHYGHEILRIRDGQIVEHLDYFDRASGQALGKAQ